MKKIIVLLVAFPILFTSCVPQKKYAALETQQKETQELLNSATVKLNACLDEKATTDASIAELRKQNQFLIENNQDLINNMGNLTTLTKKGACLIGAVNALIISSYAARGNTTLTSIKPKGFGVIVRTVA